MDSRKHFFAAVALALVSLTACTTAGRPDLSGMSFSSEPLLGKVVWYDLVTEDLAAAQRFYGGLFGWTFEDSVGAGGEAYRLARKGNVIVAGMVEFKAPSANENYSRWLPYLSVDDVDAAVSRGRAAGATVAAAARDIGFGRVAAIVDPQGAVIGLARSDLGDPDDATTAAGPGRPVWTELLANDPQAAAAFYGRLANYNERTIQRRGGEYTVLTSDGVDRAGIFENPASEQYTPVWLTTFGVSDPAAAAAKAQSLGGKIILAASSELRDGTTAVVTDPSGAVLVLRSL